MTQNKTKQANKTQTNSGKNSKKNKSKKKKIVNVKGEEDDTTSTRTRHWLTNDILAFVLVVSFIGLIAVAGQGFIDLSAIPTEIRVVYVSLVGAAGAWAFGETAFKNWFNARKGGGK